MRPEVGAETGADKPGPLGRAPIWAWRASKPQISMTIIIWRAPGSIRAPSATISGAIISARRRLALGARVGATIFHRRPASKSCARPTSNGAIGRPPVGLIFSRPAARAPSVSAGRRSVELVGYVLGPPGANRSLGSATRAGGRPIAREHWIAFGHQKLIYCSRAN